MANRLSNEKSLYLKQHAENPVDWYPWGEEAFAKAKAEDKPILVSIGYSACHWCHVMAHESFENDYIAGIMNRNFVCIKVDREERPDVDQIYMEAVQMMQGHGGWPLNIFCLPDGKPFAGGTYFPPDDHTPHNMIPWPQLLVRVADFYKRERPQLEENANNILMNLSSLNNPVKADRESETIDPRLVLHGAQDMCEQHDDDFGGFGDAPKFPPAMTLEMMLELRNSATVSLKHTSLAERIDEVIPHTLRAMALGGLYDQLGGGFCRYSVDKFWLIPHFEKMLYDNGLLLDIYAKAWQRYKDPLFKAIVEETVSWLQREMTSPEGAFYASVDADSEGEEGKFYVWTPDQIKEVLGEEAGERFCSAYAISEEGNFEHGTSNPAFVSGSFEERESLLADREKLLAHRNTRIRPTRDDKHLVSWNSLVIRGLAEAAFIFGRRDWYTMALRAADWIATNMMDDAGRLQSVHYGDEVRHNGYLDDYAFYAEALLALAAKADWYQPGTSAGLIQRAEQLAGTIQEHFADNEGHGFYFTSDDHEVLISRRKEWFDNAIPSGNSCTLHVFSQLYALTGENKWGVAFAKQEKAFVGLATKLQNAIPHAIAGWISNMVGIAVIRAKDVGSMDDLQKELTARPWRRVFILGTEDEYQPAGYQLCVGTQCLTPTPDAAQVAEFLIE